MKWSQDEILSWNTESVVSLILFEFSFAERGIILLNSEEKRIVHHVIFKSSNN